MQGFQALGLNLVCRIETYNSSSRLWVFERDVGLHYMLHIFCFLVSISGCQAVLSPILSVVLLLLLYFNKSLSRINLFKKKKKVECSSHEAMNNMIVYNVIRGNQVNLIEVRPFIKLKEITLRTKSLYTYTHIYIMQTCYEVI